MYTPDLTKLKEETLRWIFSIFSAVLVYLVLASIATAIYHPDIDQLKNTADKILAETYSVRPEPLEALLFRLAVITIIPGILGFYILFSKPEFIKTLANKPVYLYISALCLVCMIALIYFDFAAFNPYGPKGGDVPQNKRDSSSITNFDFYFDGLFLGNYLWLYALVLLPAIGSLFLIGFKKYNWDNKKSFQIISSLIGYTIAAGSIVAMILMNTFSFPYSNDNKYDFGAVYYSMTQVFAGSPMLVDHFTNTYGLYPHFLNPLFQITGLNVFKFSLVMSLLTGLSFALNLFSLKKLVSNHVILFLGFASVLFFPYLDFKLTNAFDCIFSYYPIRYIIPSTLIYLSILYLEKKSLKIYRTTFTLSAMFVLWNPEMGLVCYISWLLVNIYNDFYSAEGKIAPKKILYHCGAGIVVLVAVFYSYKLLIYAFYGAWPDLSLLFGTITVFSKVGLMLLPMSLVHPWNLMALVLILGFTWPIVKWYKKEVTPKSSIVLLISLISLGYFVYFQGRSQNSNFALSSGYCLFLLTILGDELWKTVKNANVFLLNALFIVFLFFISFSFAEILFNTHKMIGLVYQEEDKTNESESQEKIESNTDFICQNSAEKEKIIVISQKKNQALLFDGNKRVSGFNPGFIDLFLLTDRDRLESILTDSSFSVFIEPSNRTYPYMARPTAALAASYEFKAVNKSIVLLNKRKNMIPSRSFFGDTDSLVLHRKYSDDAAGIKLRVDDAFGIATITIAPQFSVEALFYSVPQMFPNATIVGNAKDSSGFAMGNVFNSSNCMFSVNATGFALPLPYNQWVYCVMNIYHDHLEVYKNGALSFSGPLSQPMKTSYNQISIGNLGSTLDFNYYAGPISEVAVANKVLDSNQIRATWRDIQQVIHQ